MTRRDTIIIATLVNAGLLACLFVTATRQEEFVPEALQTSYEVANNDIQELNSDINFEVKSKDITSLNATPTPYASVQDDVDLALREFLPDHSYGQNFTENENGIEADLNPELVKEVTPKPLASSPPSIVIAQVDATPKANEKMVEVKVKKGDMLAKIAKANGTTVKAIKDANHLLNDNLRVGQVLKVPTGSLLIAGSPALAATPIDTLSKGTDNAQYYTVISGDNPWKIAKKFHVKFEDILKLNNMTEEKAKNLKVGQEIRVK